MAETSKYFVLGFKILVEIENMDVNTSSIENT